MADHHLPHLSEAMPEGSPLLLVPPGGEEVKKGVLKFERTPLKEPHLSGRVSLCTVWNSSI